MALNRDLICPGCSSVMSVPIRLAGEKRQGISLVPALLPLLHMLCHIKQKPDFCRGKGFAKTGIQSPAESQGGLQVNKPSSITAKGSTSTQVRSKIDPVFPKGANPATMSTQWLEEDRAAPCGKQTSKSQLLATRCIFFPLLHAPTEGDIFF